MRSPLFLCYAFSAAAAIFARADYQDDTGFIQLQNELGAAMLTGEGVSMSQVEAALRTPDYPENSYLPQAGSGTFAGTGIYAGKVFTAKSGAGAYSFHANEIAAFMYGDTRGMVTTFHSMCPSVVTVDCYKANNWDDEFLAPGGLEPVVEQRDVQNHAWVSNPAATDFNGLNELLRRQDYSINRDSYVCCVGVNNGATTAVPHLQASAYNVITAGLTNGQHSRNNVVTGMDGAGRRKPEIVAPFGVTSYATGYLSGAAGLLRQMAGSSTSAKNPRTIKAILLAGATKEEFPGWSRTAADPIDAIYGAGELNIYNSYHIMNGGEQNPASTSGLPHRAWDFHTLGSGSVEYRLHIPAGMYGVELSAFLVWHRTPTAPYTSVSLPIDFNLALLRYPAAGGAAATLDSSTSSLYNLEHIWQKNLPAGNYRLRVSRGSGLAHSYGVAWRLTTAPHLPQPVMTSSGSNFQFTFPNLLIGQPYKFQSSVNLINWTDLESFTATTTSAVRLLPKPADARLLYRLQPVLP